MTADVVPFWNGSVRAARDAMGRIIGVEVRAVVLHEQIADLPPVLAAQARAVIAEHVNDGR